MIYVIPIWVLLLMLWPGLKRQRLADKLSFTRVPLVLVVLHGLLEVQGVTKSPSYFWLVPTTIGIVWMVVCCQILSWVLDILDGRVARESKVGGTKWGRFCDATTDKLSTWPIAILFWLTSYGNTELMTILTWHVPVSMLLVYDLWSTRAHYRKAKHHVDAKEHEVGTNKWGHFFGQVKHWLWSIMIGVHVAALCPYNPAYGPCVSNWLANFGAWWLPYAPGFVVAAVVSALVSRKFRNALEQEEKTARPFIAEASTDLGDSAAEAA